MPALNGQLLSRAWLVRSLATLILVFAGAFGWALISSMRPSTSTVTQISVEVDLTNLLMGQPAYFKVHDKKLIVIRPSPEQWAVLQELRPNQDARHERSYVAQLEAFIYWGQSSRDEFCELQYFPPAVSRLREVVPNAEWRGGLFDPSCEVSFDLAGRPIQEYRFSYNGYVRDDAKPLRSPKIRVSGQSIVVLPH